MEQSFEHGGNIHKFLRTQTSLPHTFFDFSANINPLGLSEKVRSSIKNNIDTIIHYPDVDGYELKNMLSQYYQVSYDSLTLGNGAVELLYILCNLIQPKTALILAPSFSEYESASRAAKAKIKYYYLNEKNDFLFDINKFLLALEPLGKNDIIFLGNPNNPTGTSITSQDLEKILHYAHRNHCFVVVDESFIDFLPNATNYTVRHLIKNYKNLIVLHSLTKFYAIPGLRLGFVITSPEFTQKLHHAKDPWNVNCLAQIAGIAALQDKEYQEKSRSFMKQEIDFFYKNLIAINTLKIYRPMVNFVLVNLEKTNIKSHELRKQLLKRDILIRDCANYPGLSNQYVRFAIKRHDENIFFIETLKKILMDGSVKND